MKALKRAFAAFLILLLTPVLFAGCYGHFPLVRTLYKANGSIELGGPKVSGFFQSILTLLMAYFQIYTIGGILDLIVFNLIEFWTGRPVFTVHTNPDGSTLAMESVDKNTLKISLEKDGKTGTYYLRKDRPGEIYTIRNGQWVLVETITMDAGELQAISLTENAEVLHSRMHWKREAEALQRRVLLMEGMRDQEAAGI